MNYSYLYPIMSNPVAPTTLSRLNEFSFNKVLHEDPFTHSIVLHGTFPSLTEPTDKIQAIVRIEKTALDSENPGRFFSENGYVQRIELEESTDIVWLVFLNADACFIMIDDVLCFVVHMALWMVWKYSRTGPQN